MASHNLTGFLRDPLGEFSKGDKIRFTHLTTTGEVIKGSTSVFQVSETGEYNIDIQYGNVVIETRDRIGCKWINQGLTTINSSTVATTLPDLLNSLVPASDPLKLELEAILADATQAKDDAEEAAAEAANSALSADAFFSSNPANIEWDFEAVFNDDIELRSGYGNRNAHGNKAVDFSRASESGNINKSGVVEAVGVDEPRIGSDGLFLGDEYTNYFANPESPISQAVNLTSGDYTLWVIGSGSVTCSHGTATELTPLTFTATNGALSLTVSGTLSLVNLIDLNKVAPPLTSAMPSSPDIATMPMMGNMPAAGEPWTIEVDCELPDAPAAVFGFGDNGGKISFTMWRFIDGGGVAIRVFGESESKNCEIPYDKTLGKKRYIFTYDDSEVMRGFVSGVKESGDISIPKSIVADSYSHDYSGNIGKANDTGSNSKTFNGNIKALRILHRALTEEQIKARGSYNGE